MQFSSLLIITDGQPNSHEQVAVYGSYSVRCPFCYVDVNTDFPGRTVVVFLNPSRPMWRKCLVVDRKLFVLHTLQIIIP
jgi:hypothetical protein